MTLQPMQRSQLLTDSIAKRSRVMVTLAQDDGWTIVKGQFRPGNRQSVLMFEPGPREEVRELGVGQEIAVTFRHGRKKCMFTSHFIKMEGGCWQLSWPDDVRQLQRRAYERVSPPEGVVIAVRFWQPDHNDECSARANAHHGQLENISAGGVRVRTADHSNVNMEETYRCVFTPPHSKVPLIVDGRLRHRESVVDGRASLGFQFVGLEASDEGRKTLERLAKLVGRFHRGQNPHRRRHDNRRGSQHTDDQSSK
ncbi:MAG: flagellar brake protein [Phycisphaerae bacterium]